MILLFFLENKYMSKSKTNFNLVAFCLILVIVFFTVFFQYFKFKNIVTEGFEWSPESEKRFIFIQDTINRKKVFDVDTIQKNQASQEDVDYFNRNGIWFWSQETKDLYIKAILSNPYVKIAPDAALLETQKIYNEAAIRMVLSHQTNEGHFLIQGVNVPGENVDKELPSGFGEFAYNSGLTEDHSNDIIRCNSDGKGMERIQYTGRDGIFGSRTSIITPVDYNDLESTVPGFTFVNGPCNPCVALNEKPDYSCPFKLKLQDYHPGMSDIWRLLWGIGEDK